MIQPMQKLSLLIYHKDYQPFLEALREKGVVHIFEDRGRSAENEELKQRLALLKRIGEVAKGFARRQREGVQLPEAELARWKKAATAEEKWAFYRRVFQTGEAAENAPGDGALLACLENRFKSVEQREQELAALAKTLGVYAPWGDLPRERMQGLRRAGWELRFFTVASRKYLPEWEEQFNAFLIREEKGQAYFVALLPVGASALPEADEVHFPAESADELRQRMEACRADKERLEQTLAEVAPCALADLSEMRVRALERTDVLKVQDASQKLLDEKVIALEGWVPAARAEETAEWLAAEDAVYELSAPAAEDNPPILLKNNRFARLFEFIGELYSLPNYREIDLTPFFAPFFVLFFGFCLGDAGYGLLILLAVTLYKPKAKRALRPVLSLAQWLGVATVVMGCVGGTFFGVSLLDAQIGWLEQFKAYMLDSQDLFNLALIIGVVQILFGMVLKVANLWRQHGFAAALSTIGWLVAILGGGACYGLSRMGYDATIPLYAVGIVAGLLVFVFNDVRRNVLVNVGAGVWDTYNMVTGLLGDTLSYIRLFALGISSAVLGLVFNDLAINMSGDIPVVKQLLMLIILVFGHGVNLFMAGLGSFVHPMRLTFVEFYKNAGFEGGGKKYAPFGKRQ